MGAGSVLWIDNIRENDVLSDKIPPQSNFDRPSVENTPPKGNEQERIVIEKISSFSQAVEIAAPAVVNIFTSRTAKSSNYNPFFDSPFDTPFFRDFFGQRGPPQDRTVQSLGSGVVIESNGIIITNHHVIAEADDILVGLHDGQRTKAEVIGSDPETDLAILQVELNNLPTLKFGNIDDVRVGDLVLAIGNPYAVGQTVTQGIISGIGRNDVGISTFENFLQTDAAINPGNSGGALINTRGELWGINTAIFSRSGGSQGIGFAIPVDLVLEIVEQIRSGGKVERGWMGLYLRDIYEGDEYIPEKEDKVAKIQVAGVYRNSPAFDAGIMSGDIILSVDGMDFSKTDQLVRYVADRLPGEIISATIKRGDSQIDFAITLSSRPLPE